LSGVFGKLRTSSTGGPASKAAREETGHRFGVERQRNERKTTPGPVYIECQLNTTKESEKFSEESFSKMSLDFAARAAMLQREVEAVARLDHQSSSQDIAVDLRLGADVTGGLLWQAEKRSPSSKEIGSPQRRDVSRERAEHRASLSPISSPHRRSHQPPSVAELTRLGTKLGDMPGATKEPPFPYRITQGNAGQPRKIAQLPASISKHTFPSLEEKRFSHPGQHETHLAGIDLSQCVSLLDEADLAGLAAAEAALALEDRDRVCGPQGPPIAALARQVHQIDPPQQTPLSPLPLASTNSAFLGVELSLD